MAAKHHRLTFRTAHLEAVRKGEKVCTVRFSAVARRVREGDRLTLAFGAYNRAELLQAVAQQVVTLDIEGELRRCFARPNSVFRPNAKTPPVLLEALQDSGGDFEILLEDAALKMATSCTAVWFSIS